MTNKQSRMRQRVVCVVSFHRVEERKIIFDYTTVRIWTQIFGQLSWVWCKEWTEL